MPVFLPQPWLMALVPVGLAIILLNNLTISLLLVQPRRCCGSTAAPRTCRQYRPAYRIRGTGQPIHPLRYWRAAAARGNQMAVNVQRRIEEVDDKTINARSAALISRCWRAKVSLWN
jgi:hypothetical protein